MRPTRGAGGTGGPPSGPDRPGPEPPDLDPRLLDLLVCPLTRGPLRWERSTQRLVSEAAGLAYPVRDGVPVMLVEEAEPWPPPGQGVQPAAGQGRQAQARGAQASGAGARARPRAGG